MMQFRDATFEEVKAAWLIMNNSAPGAVPPSPANYYDTTANLLQEIRDAEAGGLKALKCLVHTDGEGLTLKEYRRRLIQNVPHVRKIVKERVGQTYSDPPEVKIRIATEEPESDLTVNLNEYVRLIMEQNGGNNFFVRGVIRKAFRDKASRAKVFVNPKTRKILFCHLEVEKVVFIPDPNIDKLFLAALEIRKAGPTDHRFRLWTTTEMLEIDKAWQVIPQPAAEEGTDPAVNAVEGVIPYIEFGDPDECSDMEDAVMDQSAFINLRNTQHVGIKYQAFATKVIAGQVVTPVTKTKDGKQAVAGGVDHYISIEKDGEAFMLHSDFNIEGITKSVDQWRKTALQDADISIASIDQLMTAETATAAQLRDQRPQRAAEEQMHVFIPQHEQLIRTILAYAKAFDPDYQAQFGKIDLGLVSISITRNTKSIAIDKLLKRQADQADVEKRLLPVEQYIAEHAMPGADKAAVQKQVQEYEQNREQQESRITDLFPPGRPRGSVLEGANGSAGLGDGNGDGKKKPATPAERALDRVGPRN